MKAFLNASGRLACQSISPQCFDTSYPTTGGISFKTDSYMLQETTEIQELSLEKVIETSLVQSNVTDQVLATLKDKYGGMKLKALDDKESYLELKSAKKNCAKVRNLAITVCKGGREDAVKQQKLWIAKEKEVVGVVLSIETPLDEEIAKYDAEIDRKANEELKRQEEAYINRQATLTKMGATYDAGNFVLGEASFEAELIKGASQDIWDEAIVPKFKVEYERIESVRIEEERKKAAYEDELRQQREELVRQQEELKQQQAEMQRQREESERLERERIAKEQAEMNRINAELQKARFESLFPYAKYGESVEMTALAVLYETDFNKILESKKAAFEAYTTEQARIAEERRLSEIEAAKQAAIKAEQERLAQDEARKAEEIAQSSDTVKYNDFISKIQAITLPEMRSGQYRKKVAIICEHINAILSL